MSLATECNCSSLCYMDESRKICTEKPEHDGSTMKYCNCTPSSHVSDESELCLDEPRHDRSSAECTCKVLCHMDETRSGCTDNTKLSSSTIEGSCHCSVKLYVKDTREGHTDTPERPSDEENVPYMQAVHEIPVKDNVLDNVGSHFSTGASTFACMERVNVGVCSQSMPPMSEMNPLLLDTPDMRYLEQVRKLMLEDRQLQLELEDLIEKEELFQKSMSSYTPKVPQNVLKIPREKKEDPELLQLRAINKDFSYINETLKDKLEDSRLDGEQMQQRIQGPLQRELDRLRKKIAELQLVNNRMKQTTETTSVTNELHLYKDQMKNMKKNIKDMTSVNDGIKHEVKLLKHRCRQMEQVLIKQKQSEMEAINKLQKQDTTSSLLSTIGSCSCGRDEII